VLELERPDGVILPLKRTKAGELLALLALSPTKSFQRSDLAEAIWGNSDTLHTRTRLRQEIEKLHKLFGENTPSPLIHTESSLALNPQNCVTDTALFQHHLNAADAAPTPAQQAEALAAAIALYRDELLTEYAAAFEEERIRFRQLAEQAQYRLAGVYRTLGETTKAKATLTRLLALNPVMEEAHCELMRLYAESHQPSEVRRQYRELERVLQEELGTQPTEATRQLRDHLLQNGTHSVSVPSPVAALPLSDKPPENSPELPARAATQELMQQPASKQNRVSERWRFGAFVLAAIILAFGWLRPPPEPSPKPELPPKQAIAPAIPQPKYHQESWGYRDSPQPDELPNSEAKTLLIGEDGYLCATGIVETKKHDVDFLTVTLSPANGNRDRRQRFDSEGHNCDRAFSLAVDKRLGWYVAGESYFPAGFGRKEGWYHTLVHYDRDLNQLWHRYSECFIEQDQRVRVLPDGEGGAIVGATEWMDKDKRRLVFSRYDAKGNRLYQQSYLPKGAESASFRGISLLYGKGVVVCGVASLKHRPSDSDTVWVTAHFDKQGKLVWERLHGTSGKNEPQGIESDEYGNIYVFGSVTGGDTKLGTMRSIPAIVHYDQNGKGEAVFSDPRFAGEIQITGRGVSVLGGGGSVNIVGNRLTPTNDFDAFALGFSKSGVAQWTHDYAPFWDYRSMVAKAVYPSDHEQFATVAVFSKQSAPFFPSGAQMAVVWSNSAGQPLAIFFYPGNGYSGSRTAINAATATTEKIYLVGQTSATDAARFTVVAFPRSLP